MLAVVLVDTLTDADTVGAAETLTELDALGDTLDELDVDGDAELDSDADTLEDSDELLVELDDALDDILTVAETDDEALPELVAHAEFESEGDVLTDGDTDDEPEALAVTVASVGSADGLTDELVLDDGELEMDEEALKESRALSLPETEPDGEADVIELTDADASPDALAETLLLAVLDALSAAVSVDETLGEDVVELVVVPVAEELPEAEDEPVDV